MGFESLQERESAFQYGVLLCRRGYGKEVTAALIGYKHRIHLFLDL